jgi:glycosyltransferase involved in cell wall biosynthesis
MAFAGKRRRVLIVVQNLPVPFDRRVWLEATTLAQAGYAVSVISPKAKGFDASFEVLEDVHVYRYGLPLQGGNRVGYVAEFVWCFLRTAMKVARVAVTGRGFDVLQVCNPPETYWPIGVAVRLLGKKFVFDHHDLSPEMYQVKFGDNGGRTLRLLCFLELMTFSVADLVLTTNESHKAVAITRGKRQPEDVYVVRSGPDLQRLCVYPRDPEWRRGKKHLLVYLGEICEQDGVDHLVRALGRLRDAGREGFHCVLVGGGPYQARIRDYADQLDLSDVCTFTGRVTDDELCRVLSSADLAVDPDPKNDWSDKSTMNKIMEYMFFGLPIVAYDLAENRYSAQDAAVYAQGNDDGELAARISDLIDDPARRAQMASFGRQRLRQVLAWEHSAPVLLQAYGQLFDVAGSTGQPRRASLEQIQQ